MIRTKIRYNAGVKASKGTDNPNKDKHIKYTPTANNQKLIDICLSCKNSRCKKGVCDKIRKAAHENDSEGKS